MADFIGDMNFLAGEVAEAADGGFALTTGARVVVRGRGQTVKGAQVRVGIRPERIVASADAASGTANSAKAEVVTKMYLGDQIQIVTDLPGVGNVVVREQRASADPALDTIHPGDRITLSWDEAAPLLLGEAAPAAPGDRQGLMNRDQDELNILAPREGKPKLDYLHREVQRAAGRPLDRRHALGLGGMALLAAAAAACGSTSTSGTAKSSSSGSANPLAGKPLENHLEIYNWSHTTTPPRSRSSRSSRRRRRPG